MKKVLLGLGLIVALCFSAVIIAQNVKAKKEAPSKEASCCSAAAKTEASCCNATAQTEVKSCCSAASEAPCSKATAQTEAKSSCSQQSACPNSAENKPCCQAVNLVAEQKLEAVKK